MKSIIPFIEAPSIRLTEQNVSGGMDTVGFDHLRQGVSIRNNSDRYAGVMPKIGTGRNDHVTEIVTYGQGNEFTDEPIFEFIDTFDPVRYIENNQSLIFPIILANATLIDPEKAGGFIEPLPIPARDLVSIEGSNTSQGVKGALMSGNEDSWRKFDQISQFICDFKENEPEDVYIDSSDCIGEEGGDILIPGFFPEKEKTLKPFNESLVLGKIYISGSIRAAPDMEKVILAMTGSSTDNYVSNVCITSTTGFVYDNNSIGTDSLAFGGFKR